MWLWNLSDLIIISAALLVSCVMLLKLGFFPPVVATAVYAFLTIQFDCTSVKDFLRYSINYFVAKQQYYEWRVENEAVPAKSRKKKINPGPARHP